MKLYANICEHYIGLQMPINDVALKFNVSGTTVGNALNNWFAKIPDNPYTITFESVLNDRNRYIVAQMNKMSAVDIARDVGINVRTVWKIANKANVYKKQWHHSYGKIYHGRNICLILNNETGLFYTNISECAQTHNINVSTLKSYFSGKSNSKRHHKFIMLDK